MAQAKSMAQNKNHKNNSNNKIDGVGRSIEEGNCR